MAFSNEICKIFKNTHFEEYLWTTASVVSFSWLYVHYLHLRHRFTKKYLHAKTWFIFLQKSKAKVLGNRKKIFFFHLTHFRNPIFSYLRFFRKCSMLRKSIPLKMCWKVLWFFTNSRDFNQYRDFMNYVYHDKVDSQHFCLLTNQLFYKFFSHIYKKLLRFIR